MNYVFSYENRKHIKWDSPKNLSIFSRPYNFSARAPKARTFSPELFAAIKYLLLLWWIFNYFIIWAKISFAHKNTHNSISGEERMGYEELLAVKNSCLDWIFNESVSLIMKSTMRADGRRRIIFSVLAFSVVVLYIFINICY